MNANHRILPLLSLALLACGAVSLGPSIQAQTAANLPPSVRITAPPDGAVFFAPAEIVVEAEATDPDGWVSGMEVVIGTVHLTGAAGVPGTDGGTSHYRFVWPNVPVGEYLLVARAVDNLGATANSPAVRVSVVQAQPPLPVVTITAPDPVATEQSPLVDAKPDTGLFVVARTGDVQNPLTVRLEIGGTALNGIDYEAIKPEVVIPAGSATLDLPLNPIDDTLVEGEETVVIRIAPSFSVSDPTMPPVRLTYLVGDPAVARAVIRDNDQAPNQPPQVAIVSPQDGAVIPTPEALRLIAHASDADGFVTGVEFFADGVSLGVVPPPPAPASPIEVGDPHPEIDPVWPLFQLVWTNPPAGIHVLKAVATDNAGATGESAPVTITVLEPGSQQVVTVIATDPVASEPNPDPSGAASTPDTATFTIRRTGDLSIALPVYFSLGGSASNGVDYVALPLTATIPANERSVDVVVVPLDDTLIEGREHVVLTLEPPVCPAIWPPPPECYLVGAPARACAVILDNDRTNLPPVARLVHPSRGEVFPVGSDIRLAAVAHDIDGAVVSVEFFEGERSLGKVAVPPQPTPLPPDPTPPLPIRPLFSMVWSNVPAGEYVLKAVATDNLGATGDSQPVRIIVATHELPPVVTVVATMPETAEPNPLLDCAAVDCLPRPGLFTVSRTGPTTDALDVSYELGGTASNGADYLQLPLLVTIPAGQSAATVAVQALADDLIEGTETVILRLLPDSRMPGVYPSPPPRYLVGRPGAAYVRILDNELPPPVPHVEIVKPHNGQAFPPGAPIEILAVTPVVPPMAVKVEFYADDVKIGDGVEHPVSPIGVRGFGFTWTNAPAGPHHLLAKAFTADGQMGVSVPVGIVVTGDDLPPRVEIVRPHQEEVFQALVDVPIVVQATDPDGYVPHVDFYADGVKIGEQTLMFLVAPPPGETQTFSMTWSNEIGRAHV
jgi:hypothetical protein